MFLGILNFEGLRDARDSRRLSFEADDETCLSIRSMVQSANRTTDFDSRKVLIFLLFLLRNGLTCGYIYVLCTSN